MSIHGCEQDEAEMQALIEEERREERLCRVLKIQEVVVAKQGLDKVLTET